MVPGWKGLPMVAALVLVGAVSFTLVAAYQWAGKLRVFEIKLGDECLMSKSSREGQCPAVPSGYEHSLRRACSMPQATGRTLALLPSGGSMKGERASDEFFDPTAGSGRTAPSIF